MKTKILSVCILLMFILVACQAPSMPASDTSALPQDAEDQAAPAPDQPDDNQAAAAAPTSLPPQALAGPGESFVTEIDSAGIGRIALQVSIPENPRYGDRTGVVVEVNTFLTPANRFYTSLDASAVGLIHITYLWPGISDGAYSSDGLFDYGGPDSIQALSDVIRFATGESPNADGSYLDELISLEVLYDNVGLYAFSHPGQAAINVLGHHGNQFPGLAYYVGRENPTIDKLTAVEVGYFDLDNHPVLNPLYEYPQDYSSTAIVLEYDSIQWDAAYTEPDASWQGVPYFDLNSNGVYDSGDHRLALRIPAVEGKRVYSIELTRALKENRVFPQGSWPEDVADLALAKETWAYQDNTRTFPKIGTHLPDLKVMLVFARFDHVQPASDKPHVHHAYDGLSDAGIWVRLNMDKSYLEWVSPQLGGAYLDHPAGTEPVDWRESESWGYKNLPGSAQLAPLAAVAEMADRTQSGNWSGDLDAILFDYPFE